MSLADSAASVLERLGEPVTVKYETDEVRNPATGEITTPAVSVEIEGFGYPGGYSSMDVDGDTIRRSDVRLTLSKVSERPQVGWTALVDGVEYRIMDSRKVRFSGDDVVYICQLRV